MQAILRKGLIKTLWGLNLLLLTALSLSILAPFIPPKTFVFPAFFGISFPYIFILVCIITILFAFTNKKYFFINGAILLIALPQLSKTIAINTTNYSDDQTDCLKVLSYNVKLFGLYDWKNNIETRNKMFDFLKEQSQDIYCFQEFYRNKKKGYFTTRDTLTKILNTPNYTNYYTAIFGNQYFGMITFSKYPIIDKGAIEFSKNEHNAAIYSDVLYNDDTIRVYNVHMASIRFSKKDYKYFDLDSINESQNEIILKRLSKAFKTRQEQTETLLSHIEKSPHPTIICGDFNDTPNSYFYSELNNYYLDAFIESGSGIGGTYVGKLPNFRIDYIFYSNQLKSSDYKTYNTKLSDHKPISCNFNLISN